jgi:hypothetical protein
MSPSFNVVCGGWMFWARRLTANKPVANAIEFLMASILPLFFRCAAGIAGGGDN